MYSSLLNNKISVETNAEMYKNKDLIIQYDKVTVNNLGGLSPIISLIMNDVCYQQSSQFFIFNFTLDGQVQEYMKDFSLLPIYLFLNEIEDFIYIKNFNTSNMGFGYILDVPTSKNVTLYDNITLFLIDGYEITEVEISPELKKTIFKRNYPNKITENNTDYSCLMMTISNNVSLDERLMRNIYEKYNKRFPRITYEKLMSEWKNESNIFSEFAYDIPILQTTPVKDSLIINNFPILFYFKHREKLIENIINKTFDCIEEYLNYDLNKYLTKDIEEINNANKTMFQKIDDSFYLINTDNIHLNILIKTILNKNLGIPLSTNNLVIIEEDLIEALSKSIIIDLLFDLRKDLLNMVKEYFKKINEVFPPL